MSSMQIFMFIYLSSLCNIDLLFDRSTQGKGSEAFNHSLHDLLRTICEMMKLEGKENELIAPRAQAQALQFLPQTFDLFLSVLNVKSLGYE